jgi:hypothetical protein
MKKIILSALLTLSLVACANDKVVAPPVPLTPSNPLPTMVTVTRSVKVYHTDTNRYLFQDNGTIYMLYKLTDRGIMSSAVPYAGALTFVNGARLPNIVGTFWDKAPAIMTTDSFSKAPSIDATVFFDAPATN